LQHSTKLPSGVMLPFAKSYDYHSLLASNCPFQSRFILREIPVTKLIISFSSVPIFTGPKEVTL
jgi:hypothetical protein